MNHWMRSTRTAERVSIDEAIKTGLAKDGGLYVPEQFPIYSIDTFYDYSSFIEFSLHLLTPFFDESRIHLDYDFCQKEFTFPLPLKQLSTNKYALELFQGPTLSFKDFGARFFAQCLQQLAQEMPITVLVATSGDTGSAVASALHGKKGVDGVILFPKDKISLRQQMQITTWGGNIHALAVNGTFDQCQQLVKSAFSKKEPGRLLTTANSINIARLVPQMIFYAYSSIEIAKRHNMNANYIVPSGNLGNVTACYWAKALGFPIDQILISTNANDVLSKYLASGIYSPQPSRATLANAMDVGDPSNLERLIDLLGSFPKFKQQVDVESVSDHDIKKAIIDCYEKYNYVICPHTATAYHRLLALDSDKPWVFAATAHPVKFNEIIEPLINSTIPIPKSLEFIMSKKQVFLEIEPSFDSLEQVLQDLHSAK